MQPQAPADTRWWQGLSRYQWLVLLVAWLGWVFDIMDTALFNFAKGPMLKELFHGSAAQLQVVDGSFLTILLVGWSIGGLLFGLMADRWGRVRTLTLTVLIYCIFTGATAFCRSWPEVAVIRFVTALGIGGEWAAGASLLAEAFPDKARAPGAAMLQSAAAFGPWFASIVNLRVPASEWRWLFLVGVFPALVTVIIRLGVHEPEQWEKAARTDLGSLFTPFARLFGDSRWRRHAIVALVLGISGIAAANNVSYWLPNLNKAAGAGLSADTVQTRLSYLTICMHVGTLIGVFIMPWLCEKLGRKRALCAFFILSPISVAIATWGGTSFERLLLLAPLMSLFTIGMSAGFVLYFPELFPTEVRVTGVGFAYNTGRILAAGIPLLTGYAIGSSNSTGFGVSVTALVPVVGLLALMFAPETKGQGLPQER